jgi:hypothetical protein
MSIACVKHELQGDVSVGRGKGSVHSFDSHGLVEVLCSKRSVSFGFELGVVSGMRRAMSDVTTRTWSAMAGDDLVGNCGEVLIQRTEVIRGGISCYWGGGYISSGLLSSKLRRSCEN